MKKYLNRALLYKDFKSSWGVLFLPLVICFINYNLYLSQTLIGAVHVDLMNTLTLQKDIYFIVICIIGILSVLMGNENSKDIERFATMPFKNQEIFASKYFLAIFYVVYIMVIDFIFVNLLYFNEFKKFKKVHIDYLQRSGEIFFADYSHIFVNFSMRLVAAMTILIFAMLIMNIVNNKILGGIFSVVFLAAPVYILLSTLMFSQFSIGLFNENHGMLDNIMDTFIKMIYFPNFIIISDIIDDMDKVRLSVAILWFILLTILLYYSYEKCKFETLGNIFTFNFIERIFKIGIAFCFSMIPTFIVATTAGMNDTANILIKAVIYISTIIIFIIVYKLSSKFISSNKE